MLTRWTDRVNKRHDRPNGASQHVAIQQFAGQHFANQRVASQTGIVILRRATFSQFSERLVIQPLAMRAQHVIKTIATSRHHLERIRA